MIKSTRSDPFGVRAAGSAALRSAKLALKQAKRGDAGAVLNMGSAAAGLKLAEELAKHGTESDRRYVAVLRKRLTKINVTAGKAFRR